MVNCWDTRSRAIRTEQNRRSQVTAFEQLDEAEAQGSPVAFILSPIVPVLSERGDPYYPHYVRDTVDLARLCDPAPTT